MKFNESKLRPGQQEALYTIEKRLTQGKKTTAVILPCRYGKSDVIRVATLKMWNEGRSAAALALSPNTVLRSQLADSDRWKTAIDRYQISDIKGVKLAELDNMKNQFTPNGEQFLSVTTQFAAGSFNVDVFADWIESQVTKSGGLPVPVFVDECHMSSDGNQWGTIVPKFTEAGAHVVLLTATADRADGKKIPGFKFESNVVEDDVKIYRCTDGSTPEMVKVDVYEGTRTKLRIVGDVEVSFREAWTAGVLCKVSRIPFDVNLREAGVGAEGKQLLSELSVAQTRKLLGPLSRSSLLIEEGCRRMVDRLLSRQRSRSDAAAIVFCGNDREDDDTNWHPREVTQMIKRFGPRLTQVVATSADGEGKAALESFIAGHGDVLLVKQMAGVGLDIDRLKIGLDLSPTRTYAAFVQRLMRPATPYDGITVSEWISPDDVISAALFEKLVTNQGGEAVVSDLELTGSYEKPREEDPKDPDPILFPESATDGDFGDSEGNEVDRGQRATADRVLAAFPMLSDIYTHAEVVDRCKTGGLSSSVGEGAESGQPEVIDTSAQAASLRSVIVHLAHEITKHRTKGQVYNSQVWGSESRLVYRDAYRKASFPKGVELDKCNDIDALTRLRDVLEERFASFGSEKLF